MILIKYMYIFIFQKIQDDSLEENLRLAQEYQKLQMNFLIEKDNYFNLYDRQLSLDASVRDKKQVSISYFSKNNDLLEIYIIKIKSSQSWSLQFDGHLLWHVFVKFCCIFYQTFEI